MRRRLGVLGGTFDPIHFGHLDAADAARAALSIDDILFVPSHDPPHRPVDPHATAFHRFAMVALAVAERDGWRVSDLELRRQGMSFTSDTLRVLHREGWQPSQLFFIIGADAFAEIATWHEFPAVLDAAHFAVIARPGLSPDAAVARTPDLKPRIRPNPDTADAARDTGIFLVHARTRDVSSTAIRARLASGQRIDDLVPSIVARHIAAHHLYATDTHLHADNTNT